VRIWRSYGVKVVISLADITTKSGVRALLSGANRLGQVDAIFNLAVVSVMLVQLCKFLDCKRMEFGRKDICLNTFSSHCLHPV
jgi:hypothetical protein